MSAARTTTGNDDPVDSESESDLDEMYIGLPEPIPTSPPPITSTTVAPIATSAGALSSSVGMTQLQSPPIAPTNTPQVDTAIPYALISSLKPSTKAQKTKTKKNKTKIATYGNPYIKRFNLSINGTRLWFLSFYGPLETISSPLIYGMP